MAGKKATELFQLGDRVTVRYFPDWRGRIVEWYGPLGPSGMQVYRVRIRRKPKPAYIDLCEDQLLLIPVGE